MYLLWFRKCVHLETFVANTCAWNAFKNVKNDVLRSVYLSICRHPSCKFVRKISRLTFNGLLFAFRLKERLERNDKMKWKPHCISVSLCHSTCQTFQVPFERGTLRFTGVRFITKLRHPPSLSHMEKPYIGAVLFDYLYIPTNQFSWVSLLTSFGLSVCPSVY